jgi:hypothetical protein
VAPWEDLSPADQEVDMAMAEDLFAAGWTARFAAGHPQPCHCLCSVSHPQAPGICDALNAAVERTVQLRTFALTVLLCKPCAAAAGGYRAGLAQLADEAPGRTRET